MTSSFPKTLIAYSSPGMPALAAGMMIDGRDRLDAPLGEGSFGVVWRGTHVLMKKRVAIKFLHTDLERHSESLTRFRREAQAAANISHPNVCTATDFGETEAGALYLVMELLEGHTLDEVLHAEGRMPAARVIELGAQIADGLHAAHQRDILHLDLKPENLMLTALDGAEQVKILDFGIAKVPREIEETTEEDGVTQTLTRRVHGTPGYMAPEQIVDGELSPATDLYALGNVLYELLSGQLPFDDDDLVALMTKHMRDPVPALRGVAPDAQLPEGLVALVMRLLEKRPERRFESALHVRDALRAMSPNQPRRGTASYSPSPTVSAEPLTTKALAALGAPSWLLPAAVAAIFTALLMLIVVITAVVASRGGADEEAEEPVVAVQQADAAPDLPAAPTIDTSTLEGARDALRARAEVRAAMEALATGDPDDALGKLDALVAAEPEDAHLRYLRGLASMRAKKRDQALIAYTNAARLDARYAEDETLLKDMPLALRAGKGDGQQLLIALMKSKPPATFGALLVKVATEESNGRARRTAQDVLEGAALWAAQPQWVKDAYALWSADACPAQTRYIKSLGESGESGGLPVLRYWSRKPTKGCGFLRRKDCHECIRGPLRSAIRKLKKSQEDDPADAPSEAAQGEDDAE
jgi:eukaryotic-like serine/threonine-protein kinase